MSLTSNKIAAPTYGGRVKPLLFSLSVLGLVGCAGVQRVPLKNEVVVLRDGRFIGPIEIPVPRRADHDGHDFELRITLRSRCTPKLVLAFPDGETETIGDGDSKWQDLLVLRAQGESVQQTQVPMPAQVVAPPPPSDGPPPMPMPAPQETAPLPYPGPSASASASVAVDTTVVVTPVQPAGRWQSVTTETWNGQLAFERERANRCAQVREYRTTYLNAYDETGMITVWAEVPQELAEASLRYEIVELVPPKVEPPSRVEASAAAVVTTTPPPKKERPPPPAPRRESPAPAADARATWIPGQWVWHDGDGEWVWHGGSWGAPAAPALKVEATGNPPNPGCTWRSGYWTWESRDGKWVWQPGYWKAPPPLQDVRGEPPGPGAPWIEGSWAWAGVRFEWTPGRWGKPPPLAETPGAQPFAGAQWVRGDWILVSGRWVWSPGFYEGAQRPPPPRAENPGVAPGPGAVWLQGYWRWEVTRSEYVWIAGHWELPPGEGYVWVPEPQAGGLVIRGHWELGVRIVP